MNYDSLLQILCIIYKASVGKQKNNMGNLWVLVWNLFEDINNVTLFDLEKENNIL